MKTYLYLDDERNPKTDHDWVIVRSFDQAIQYVTENGIPNYISFDNDLGTDKEGYDFAMWLVEKDLDNVYTFPDDFEFNVHSANCVVGPRIVSLLTNYLRSR